eukprot:1417993-Rhodomonas_salina.1
MAGRSGRGGRGEEAVYRYMYCVRCTDTQHVVGATVCGVWYYSPLRLFQVVHGYPVEHPRSKLDNSNTINSRPGLDNSRPGNSHLLEFSGTSRSSFIASTKF